MGRPAAPHLHLYEIRPSAELTARNVFQFLLDRITDVLEEFRVDANCGDTLLNPHFRKRLKASATVAPSLPKVSPDEVYLETLSVRYPDMSDLPQCDFLALCPFVKNARTEISQRTTIQNSLSDAALGTNFKRRNCICGGRELARSPQNRKASCLPLKTGDTCDKYQTYFVLLGSSPAYWRGERWIISSGGNESFFRAALCWRSPSRGSA